MCGNHADCPAERAQQSDHSPGPVDCDERLARIIYTREHLDPDTKKLKPAAFSITDLQKRGLSLVRVRHITAEELEERGRKFEARRPDNKFEGVGLATTGQVRSLRDDQGRQAFCVIDDGEPNFPSHAMAIRSADQNRELLRRLREDLVGFFSPVRRVNEAVP